MTVVKLFHGGNGQCDKYSENEDQDHHGHGGHKSDIAYEDSEHDSVDDIDHHALDEVNYHDDDCFR